MRMKEQKTKFIIIKISMFHRRVDTGFPLVYFEVEMVKICAVTITIP
jgi:hypothetical protein